MILMDDGAVSDNLPLYWWEGYYGAPAATRRIVRGQKPLVRNFGDEMSPFIVSRLAGQQVEYRSGPGKLLAIGSIFFALCDRDHVWGAGLAKPEHVQFATKAQKVTYHAVRGPRTHSVLRSRGIDCPAVYGDPAILLPHLVSNDISPRKPVGVVLHYDHRKAGREAFRDSSIMVDVENPLARVVCDILSCEVILTSSLHGLIIAEAYGRPALLLIPGSPASCNLFKYEDYFESTDRELVFRDFTKDISIDVLVEIARNIPRPKFPPADALVRAFPFGQGRALQVGPPHSSWKQLYLDTRQADQDSKPVGQLARRVLGHLFINP